MDIGNIIATSGIILTVLLHLLVFTIKLTKFTTSTELRMDAFEKTCTTIMSACSSCYLKKKHDEMEKLVVVIKERQEERIAKLPLQLKEIHDELIRMNGLIEKHMVRDHNGS